MSNESIATKEDQVAMKIWMNYCGHLRLRRFLPLIASSNALNVSMDTMFI